MPKHAMAISTHPCLFSHPAMPLETRAAMWIDSYHLRACPYQVRPVRHALLSRVNFPKLNHLPEATPSQEWSDSRAPEPSCCSVQTRGFLRDSLPP